VIYLSPVRDTLLFSALLPALRPNVFRDITSQLERQFEREIASIEKVQLSSQLYLETCLEWREGTALAKAIWCALLSLNGMKILCFKHTNTKIMTPEALEICQDVVMDRLELEKGSPTSGKSLSSYGRWQPQLDTKSVFVKKAWDMLIAIDKGTR
jgi:hypothetical protein